MTVFVHEFLQLFGGEVAAFQVGHLLLDIDGGDHTGGCVSGVGLAAVDAAVAVARGVDGRHRPQCC